ncbi:MAG: hypothetical protein HY438_02835 [DPANN group archaeon]|nr:hypothetical protein [DPANN group archaeon]
MTDRVEDWLAMKKLNVIREFRQQIRALLDSVISREKMNCFSCRSEATAICSYCFGSRVGGWLNKQDKNLGLEFACYFREEIASPKIAFA